MTSKNHKDRFSCRQWILIPLLAGGFFSTSATAVEANAPSNSGEFVVKSIRVEGLKRIDEGTVFNDLLVKVGDTFETAQSAEVIHRLFASGFYSDVHLLRDGNTLVVQVQERPSIGKLTVTGNKDIKKADLQKALEGVGIAEGQTFEQSVLSRVEQELEQQYYSRGKYGIKIDTKVTKMERNRVAVDITISEGVAAKIHAINIVGNHAFTEKELEKDFTLTTSGWFTWFTGSDQYSKEKLRGDLETLQSYYLDRGYLNFKVNSTQVSITPDKKDVYITINISEGEQYKIADVQLAGNFIVPETELKNLIDIKSGDLFSRRKINDVNTLISDRLGEEGYAFAKVNPVRDVNDKAHTVSLTLFVDPGSRVYVRRVNFTGNDVTETEVLRREMRQFESAPVSTVKIKRSRVNLMLLGFFEDVNIDTKPVAGTNDQVDVDVAVKERNSGQLTGSVGYSQLDGVLFNLGIKQTNFLGTGKLVDFAFNHSISYTSYSIGYNNPYYTQDGVSRGFTGYYQTTDLSKVNIINFSRDRVGGSVIYGIPITELDRGTLGLSVEQTRIKIGSGLFTTSDQVSDFLKGQSETYSLYKVNIGWSHNSLDRAIFPTSGLSEDLNLQVVVPGSDLEYYVASSSTSWYHPLYKDQYVLLLRGEVDYGGAYGKTSEFPFFENFYAGGIGSVRGYRGNTLGPRDSLGDPMGGNLLTTATTELIFPMPFVESNALRTSVFVDAGNVFSTHGDKRSDGGLRYTAGITAQWMSPLGAPFVFSLSTPLNQRKGDRTEVFQFNIGSTF